MLGSDMDCRIWSLPFLGFILQTSAARVTHHDSGLSAPPHDKDVIVAAVAKHVLVAITSRHAKVAKICHRSHKYNLQQGPSKTKSVILSKPDEVLEKVEDWCWVRLQ